MKQLAAQQLLTAGIVNEAAGCTTAVFGGREEEAHPSAPQLC